MEFVNDMRYPPYSDQKTSKLNMVARRSAPSAFRVRRCSVRNRVSLQSCALTPSIVSPTSCRHSSAIDATRRMAASIDGRNTVVRGALR